MCAIKNLLIFAVIFIAVAPEKFYSNATGLQTPWKPDDWIVDICKCYKNECKCCIELLLVPTNPKFCITYYLQENSEIKVKVTINDVPILDKVFFEKDLCFHLIPFGIAACIKGTVNRVYNDIKVCSEVSLKLPLKDFNWKLGCIFFGNNGLSWADPLGPKINLLPHLTNDDKYAHYNYQ